jgi:hypothetical protein
VDELDQEVSTAGGISDENDLDATIIENIKELGAK